MIKMSQMKLDMVLSYFLSVKYRDSLGHCCWNVCVNVPDLGSPCWVHLWRKKCWELNVWAVPPQLGVCEWALVWTQSYSLAFCVGIEFYLFAYKYFEVLVANTFISKSTQKVHVWILKNPLAVLTVGVAGRSYLMPAK